MRVYNAIRDLYGGEVLRPSAEVEPVVLGVGCGVRVFGVWCWVWGLGFGVSSLVFGVWGLGFHLEQLQSSSQKIWFEG